VVGREGQEKGCLYVEWKKKVCIRPWHRLSWKKNFESHPTRLFKHVEGTWITKESWKEGKESGQRGPIGYTNFRIRKNKWEKGY